MPSTTVPAAVRRVAVVGWSDEVGAFLEGVTVAAVGARSAAQLVRARTATGAPCFQHLAEMVRRVDYDLVLFSGEEARDLAAVAARRGAALAALPAGLSAAALGALAAAATLHDRPLHLVQPAPQRRAIALARRVLDRHGPPAVLRLAVDDPRGEIVALRGAAGLAARLLPGPMAVTAAAVPAASLIGAQIRGERRTLAMIEAREQATPSITARMETPSASVHLELAPDRASVTLFDGEARERRFSFDDEDEMTNDITQRLGGGAAPGERAEALRQAALLGAIESALGSGQTHVVARPDARSMLRLLPGAGRATSPPAGRLHAVS